MSPRVSISARKLTRTGSTTFRNSAAPGSLNIALQSDTPLANTESAGEQQQSPRVPK